jgi:hypothetical protein
MSEDMDKIGKIEKTGDYDVYRRSKPEWDNVQ